MPFADFEWVVGGSVSFNVDHIVRVEPGPGEAISLIYTSDGSEVAVRGRFPEVVEKIRAGFLEARRFKQGG